MGSNQIETEKVLFLHGFWGKSSDWNFLKENEFSKNFESLSYTEIPEMAPHNFLSDWGQNFLKWKRHNRKTEKITAVGYSQGGRLLLQAFAVAPEEFNQIVLISAHPGLKDFGEKEQRLSQDRQWAKKFRSMDWENLQKLWNEQSVFKVKQSPIKLESEFSRETLAHCLENWSLAHQQDFRELINSHSKKIKIILGDEDSKYIRIYQEFLIDQSILKMEKGAAHRVPFDQPKLLVETLKDII